MLCNWISFERHLFMDSLRTEICMRKFHAYSHLIGLPKLFFSFINLILANKQHQCHTHVFKYSMYNASCVWIVDPLCLPMSRQLVAIKRKSASNRLLTFPCMISRMVRVTLGSSAGVAMVTENQLYRRRSHSVLVGWWQQHDHIDKNSRVKWYTCNK